MPTDRPATPIFLVLFEAIPNPDSLSARGGCGGAFINCWIRRPTLDEAIRVARERVEADGWQVGEPEEAYPVDETTYPPGKEGREEFERAKVDGEAFVIYEFEEAEEEE